MLLKQAIRDVSVTMGRQLQHNATITTDDEVGWTLDFFRSAEDDRFNVMEKCALAYPKLATLADYRNPIVRKEASPDAAGDHAVHLARASVTDEIVALKKKGLDTGSRSQRKEHILVLLKRLPPGTLPNLNATSDQAGKPHEFGTSQRSK